MVGNEHWRFNVQSQLDKEENRQRHYKEMEIEVFRIFYERLTGIGKKVIEIERHFAENFNINHSTFYRKLKKAGKGTVL